MATVGLLQVPLNRRWSACPWVCDALLFSCAPIPEQLFWDVLTDYENLSSFIPNLSSSELVTRSGNTVQLRQVGSQQLLGLRFSAQVLLELTEYRPEGLLRFHMLKGDFRRFEGPGASLVFLMVVRWSTS